MNDLLTYGYGATGATVAELARLAAGGALIMDIRYSPISRRPEWRKAALSKALGGAYLHLQALGNLPTLNGPPIELANEMRGMEILGRELRRRPVVLLCACVGAAGCHRGYVAAAAALRWPELVVRHLVAGEGGG